MNKRMIKNLILRLLHPNKFKTSGGGGIQKTLSVCLKDCTIIVNGKNSDVVFGRNCMLSGAHIYIKGDNCHLIFGDNVHINASKHQQTHINVFGDDKKVTIGNNCLISNNVEIHTTDYHKIYDKSGKRINDDKDIIIGNSVWIGLGVTILKGSIISDGCIIGAKAMISGKMNQKNAIIVGSPAKVIREDVYWSEL